MNDQHARLHWQALHRLRGSGWDFSSQGRPELNSRVAALAEGSQPPSGGDTMFIYSLLHMLRLAGNEHSHAFAAPRRDMHLPAHPHDLILWVSLLAASLGTAVHEQLAA